MRNRIYVANLPAAPDANALRAHFRACGLVSDVEIVVDRNPGRGRGTAFVEMSNEAGATRAIEQLNGSLFEGQLLLIEAAPARASSGGASARKAEKVVENTPARITMQFRESTHMTYELNCGGAKLVLRIYFPPPTGEWRIVAQAGGSGDPPSTSATASSRLQALKNLVGDCHESGPDGALAHIDWAAVELAMREVRAL